MRIAIYSHSISPSIDGVCRRFTSILHELDRQGHETILFTMEENPEDIPAKTKTIFLDYMIFPSYPDKKVARPTLINTIRMYNALSLHKPDILHVVADGFSHMFTLAAMLTNTPIVGSFHTDILDLINTHNAFLFQKLCVLTKEFVDNLVFNSCATTSYSFQKKLKNQCVNCEHIIETAVNNELFNKDKRNEDLRKEMTFNDPNPFLLVYVGRISNEKRLDIVISALKKLKKNSTKTPYLAIIGDGPAAPKYLALHGKENQIYCQPKFLNHPKLAEIYASSDLHVSASEFETLGNTVLEAFSCSIPVVVPRTQGFLDTVEDKKNGFLFVPADSNSASEYIQLLMDDENLRIKMGNYGRESIKKNTITNVCHNLLIWYRKNLFKVDNDDDKLIKNQPIYKSSPIKYYLKFLLLIVCVPLTIFMFFIYDILVNIILKRFISYSKTEIH